MIRRILFPLLIVLALPGITHATRYYRDADGDSWGDCQDWYDSFLPPLSGWVDRCGDCDDSRGYVHPGAQEIPADGIDENCNGGELCYWDTDGDSFGDAATIQSNDMDCDDIDESWNPLDCDDSDASVYPGAPEIPNDGIDQDCNGSDLTDPVSNRRLPWSRLKGSYR